ncbi:DUF2232 domain-containing protein [Clostridium manihotivorum]|uniref:DUF2232 domain-containing protein n=1 Tax=Clostridium manihotivorum TaxID=2320868 RepID=A0A410DMZ5_9CLOT|nr:DUF2232 domain-containing protein [Clostridium manihotivorum]QAA30427.1 hypothetical protein C1I91_01345 [Clostridium manihotivorum]
MNNNKHTARSTVEAGLMSIVVFILFLITAYIPIIGSIGSFILPIPIALLYIRHNRVVSILCIIVSSVLISMFVDPMHSISAVVVYGLSGLALGFSFSRGYKATFTMIITSVTNLVGSIVSWYINIYIILNMSLTKMLEQIVDMIKQSAEMSKNMGMNSANNPLYDQIKNLDVNFFLFSIPGGIIVVVVVTSILNYLVAQKLLKNFNIKLSPIRSFKEWYLDNRIGALIIVFVCVGIVLKSKGIYIGNYIYSSSMIIFDYAFVVVGAAVTFYYLTEKFKVNKALAGVICGFFIISAFQVFLFYVGLIDLLLDIRGLDPNSLGNALRRKFLSK